MTPISYIFTELNKIQTQLPDEAFGPLGTGTASEKQFNLTNIFKALPTEIPKAFAVTDGILFIVPQKGSTDLVNIFLKPTNPVEIGIKIKYYVYRGVQKGNYFQASGSSVDELLKKDNSNILPFLTKIWDEFLEFNQIPAANANTVPFEANKIGFSPAILANYQAFFTKNQYTLPKVKIGDQIGNFGAEFGFEVVVDEGDFSQDRTDTGFDFKQDYFTARKCVLNLDKNNDAKDYGNLPDTIVSEKIFREAVYLFLDPAAYYGSHVTTNNNKNEGTIVTPAEQCKTPPKIYTVCVKFLNNDKTYLYIKSKRNRSYSFYPTVPVISNPIEITSDTNNNFSDSQWPLRILNNNNFLSFKLNVFSSNCSMVCHIGMGAKSIYRPSDLLLGSSSLNPTPALINFPLPHNGGFPSKKIPSIIYLNYDDGKEVQQNNLFGRVNLKTIFEREDFTTGQGSFVYHVRPILIKEGEEMGMYQTKVLLEGIYISDTTPPTLPSNPTDADLALSTNLRTYILFPQVSTLQKKGTITNPLTAGYYSAKDMEEYVSTIYGGGEIWKGIINDGSGITSLQYRSKESDDNLPIYQLGISQKEYLFLEGKAKAIDADATNFFFHLEEDTPANVFNFIRFKLKMQFDKKNGTLGIITDSVALYTTDGYFFFTKDYSANFKYGKEFAETTVEFRPHQDWDGEFGMDWYRKGQNTWFNDPSGNKIYDNLFGDIVGTYPSQTDGNEYEDSLGNEYSFSKDKIMLSKLKKKEYDFYPTTWTLADNETECFVAWLSLDKGKTAKLNLRIRVKKEAAKLRIRYPKKYFKITTGDYADPLDANFNFYDFPPAQKAVTATARFFDLEVTCIDEFPFTQILEVKADDKLAGVLKAFPNANKPVQNILFVPVKIKMPDGKQRNFSQPTTPPASDADPSPVATDYISNQKDWLEQFLLHSQIKANIEMFNDSNTPLTGNDYRQLDLTADDNFKQEFAPDDANPINNKGMFVRNTGTSPTYSLRSYYYPSKTNRLDLKQYLTDHLPAKYKEAKYNNYLMVFFVNIIGFSMKDDVNKDNQLGGYSNGKGTNLLVFKLSSLIKRAVSHEVYHSLDMPHTFDKLDDNSLYAYRAEKTDNLMDYSHLAGHTIRSLYHWQWIIARKNIKK